MVLYQYSYHKIRYIIDDIIQIFKFHANIFSIITKPYDKTIYDFIKLFKLHAI